MKYKDIFINYYILNPLKECYEDILQNVFKYWYCYDCDRYHSSRTVRCSNRDENNFYYSSCSSKKNIESTYKEQNIEYDKDDIDFVHSILTKED
jgi:hypothetical protein